MLTKTKILETKNPALDVISGQFHVGFEEFWFNE
jgi:hypothetical protein